MAPSRQALSGRFGPHVGRALGNSAFLLGERLITLGLNFLVSILLARYLGPEQFGSLSYATTFVALASAITYLGFGSVVVQELIRHPSARSETMGVVVYSKLAAAIVAVGLTNLIAHAIVEDPRDRLLILLISISMLFDVGLALRLHFEALTQSRSVVVIASLCSFIGALARVAAVALDAPLWVFALVITAQAALAAAGYANAYRRHTRGDPRLTFSFDRARTIFAASWPLMISFVASTIYLRIDQFMLGQMRGMADVGTYAIAARLSEVWYVIPTAVVVSVFPRLVVLRTEDAAKYRRRVQESIRYLFFLGLLVAVSVSLVAEPLVVFAFGEEYRSAGLILAIHVWACPAVYMGVLVEKWLVAEGLTKLFISRQLTAAAVNVGLNLWLIPEYGGVGAAIATVAAYTVAYYLSCFADKRTRPAGLWMTQAIFWPLTWATQWITRRI